MAAAKSIVVSGVDGNGDVCCLEKEGLKVDIGDGTGRAETPPEVDEAIEMEGAKPEEGKRVLD